MLVMPHNLRKVKPITKKKSRRDENVEKNVTKPGKISGAPIQKKVNARLENPSHKKFLDQQKKSAPGRER